MLLSILTNHLDLDRFEMAVQGWYSTSDRILVLNVVEQHPITR